MNPTEAKQRIENLSNEINSHNYKYYVLAEPSISDFQFDQLLKELEYLESQFPEFKLSDSPTQKVGGEIIQGFVTEKHKRSMLSLGNTYNETELREFDERVRNSTGLKEIEYVCELKFDGGWNNSIIFEVYCLCITLSYPSFREFK